MARPRRSPGLPAGLVHVEIRAHRGAAVEARGLHRARGSRERRRGRARGMRRSAPGGGLAVGRIPLRRRRRRRRRRRTRPHPATPGDRARPAHGLASRSPCPSPPLLSDLSLGSNEEGRCWKGARGGRGALLAKVSTRLRGQRSCGELKNMICRVWSRTNRDLRRVGYFHTRISSRVTRQTVIENCGFGPNCLF